nr:ATP-binding protein [uncultured Actinoplanes sp.]
MIRRRASSDPALLLLRSVCHEVRPSMATLSSLMHAIEEQSCPVRRGEMARLAAEHAAHAQSVLREATELAAGLTRPVDEGVPLREVLPSVRATVPDGRLWITATSAASRWPVPHQHLRQVLINLVDNAARYSSGAIQLAARARGRRLSLTIADQGALTADLLHALQRRTPPIGEKGLGLWLVRRLVTAHGGRLRARAAVPTGVIMEVLMPRFRG